MNRNMKNAIQYGIYIDSQTMKYISFRTQSHSAPPVFTFSCHLLFTEHSPLLSAGEKSH